ncbi:nitrate reductase [Ferrimonas aestuarii]|uniref:Nitrate reductase n=1 Tax=Ferrimonas aestuarii TaxID=2569539 RepID=A0A4U1BK40_9GAMM|nr:molybdopterin-dependent oxidoreductase [Ferrimonas aestuarii]TKB51804.1 nitrate reductase [Ferrimonas aestuarii]
MATSINTTCPYCGVGCGVTAQIDEGNVSVAGDRLHPVNRGKLCSKGLRLADTLSATGRLLYPSIGGQRQSWSKTTAYIAHQLNTIKQKHGADAIGFYLSGQLLTEDYYVANKLMKGFIGSANVDTNSRLCMASAVAAHKRAFGEDLVPGCFDDLEQAQLVVLAGSNMAWCHPILFQRLLAAREKDPNKRLVVIDPRATVTAQEADLHLPIKPGTDLALFHGLSRYLIQRGAVNPVRVSSQFAKEIERYSIEYVANVTEVSISSLTRFYQWFAQTENVVSGFSMGINQSLNGTDQANAIINCHWLTERLGKPGMGPLSLTGQPNAMGGREVGGLANTLAGHLEFGCPSSHQALQEFWQAPNMAVTPGLKAVEMFEAMANGDIKAVWIMGTNPMVSLPESDLVKRALQTCPLVIVSDCMAGTDTQAFADVLLPALPWGEKSGTVTNSERRLSRQRPLQPGKGEAKADWWALCQVAKAMGFATGFDYLNEVEIFREHAALSGINAANGGQFDISGLQQITDAQYQKLPAIQWPQRGQNLVVNPQRIELSQLQRGAGLVMSHGIATLSQATETNNTRWLINSGRSRDQWHTMTRTGLSSRLWRHQPVPQVCVHPQDLRRLNARDDDLLFIGDHKVLAVAKSDDSLRIGELFMPMHWSEQFAQSSRVNGVTEARVDSVSGQPGFKQAIATVSRVEVRYWCQILLPPQQMPELSWPLWQVYTPSSQGLMVWLATDLKLNELELRLQKLMGEFNLGAPSVSQRLPVGIRQAHFEQQQLKAAAFVAAERYQLPGDYLMQAAESTCDTSLFRQLFMTQSQSAQLLCSCLQISEQQVDLAIEAGAQTPDQVADACGAGTGCGSCRFEISQRCQRHSDQVQQHSLAKSNM